jgi:hypothetical protein
MTRQPQRSLKYEYELYVEEEIENYKDSISRDKLLKIGDEAVTALRAQPQFALTEMIIWQEVDKIIRKRLRIPSYTTWRRRRIKAIEELRRPERWGLRSDEVLVREVHPSPNSHALVADDQAERTALYLAAHGCEVTTVDPDVDAIERVMAAAEAVGLAAKVHPVTAGWQDFEPAEPVSVVIYSPSALAGLTAVERTSVIATLQSATNDGGVHLVRTIAAGHQALTLEELRANYDGWRISVESAGASMKSFLARKVS